MLPTTPADYDAAAALYRACRVRGETVRKLIDCLIAAVAIRAEAEVLHADADFAVMARHTDLRLLRLEAVIARQCGCVAGAFTAQGEFA